MIAFDSKSHLVFGYFLDYTDCMIFHVDLDAFFASIEQRDNPKLRGKPVIVGGPAKHRGVVAAASYEARKYGLHSAMPLATAFRLCPHVILIPPRFKTYSDESERFYKVLSLFTPFVEPVSIDEAYLSFYGFETYYGDFTKLAEKIKRTIFTKIGVTASIGLATNKTIAKVASNKNKPDGLTYVPVGIEKAFLANLMLRDLPGIGIKTEAKLTSLGVQTIGQLATLSQARLSILFGKHGVYLWQAANGLGDQRLMLDWEQKSFGAETTFLFDTNDKEFIEQTVYFLSLRIASDLRKEGKLARGVTIKLRNFRFQTQTHQAKVAFTIDSTKLLFILAKTLLYRVWDKKTMLRLIGVSTFALTRHSIQGSLFETIPTYAKNVETTLDQIRKKHGFWSIIPGALLSIDQNQATPPSKAI